MEPVVITSPRRTGLIVLAVILIILVGGGIGLWLWYRSGGLQAKLAQEVTQRVGRNQSEIDLLNNALGFNGPRTYLVLFLNNTELRPGGGFIGAYATVKIERGKPQILKVEGTEILDNLAPKDFPSVPPEPLKRYLYIDRWNLRDSNWSPDFTADAVKAMELYKNERGLLADEVSGVIGFTPTVIEELLKITGPIKVNGQEYNAQNFTEKLEYEVEYGYAQKGLEFSERKKPLTDISSAMMIRLVETVFTNWNKYLNLVQHMKDQKQALAYSANADEQKVLESQGWAGEMKPSFGDYLLWADANLASLKTDLAIDRTLYYSIAPTTSGKYIATAKMKYVHHGQFDWRTTRYRTYARIFVPLGSKLVKVIGSLKNDRSTEAGTVEQGVENGRQWFGTFIAIEPGKTGELSFVYELSPEVVKQTGSGLYSLYVQKQLGTIQNKLMLNIDFGKKILSATPGENPEKYGDTKYEVSSDLLIDRQFDIKLTE